MAQDVIRFAVGKADGPRSGVWRVWTGGDGSVYVGARETAGRFKASLHPSGQWHVAFHDVSLAKKLAVGAEPTSRFIDTFGPPSEVGPGVRRAFRVLIPWQAVVMPPHGKATEGAVVWLPELAPRMVAECAVVLTASEAQVGGWPGRTREASLVGRLPLPGGASAWVVSWTRRVQPSELTAWYNVRLPLAFRDRLNAAYSPDANFRLTLGGDAPDGSRFVVEIYVPWPPPAPKVDPLTVGVP
jgi:hypothetical protein